MLKKALLIAGAALALATAVSAEIPMPPCMIDGSCRVDVR